MLKVPHLLFLRDYSLEDIYHKVIILAILSSIIGILLGVVVTQRSDAQSSHRTEIASTTLLESVISTLEKYVAVVAGIAEIGVVILLYKTVKDFAELAKVSKLQTEVRFRPWIGPSGTISKVGDDGNSNRHQYAITLKNFGEVPSSTVIAMSSISVSLPTREIFKKSSVLKFNLGPLLPNMEKKYWIFLDQDLTNKTQAGRSDIFLALCFTYEYAGGKSAYGMISQFDIKNDVFIHRDMWLE